MWKGFNLLWETGLYICCTELNIIPSLPCHFVVNCNLNTSLNWMVIKNHKWIHVHILRCLNWPKLILNIGIGQTWCALYYKIIMLENTQNWSQKNTWPFHTSKPFISWHLEVHHISQRVFLLPGAKRCPKVWVLVKSLIRVTCHALPW